MRQKQGCVSCCLLWPVFVPFRLMGWLVNAASRLLTVIVGVMLISLGLLASFTLIGIVVGIPLIILGTLLLIRGIF